MSWAATAFRVCAWRYAWLRCLWAAAGPAGPGCGACGRRRGLRGLVAVPVGGGGAWLGYSRRRERAGVEGTRNSSGRPVGGARPAGPGRASRRRAERSSWRGRRAGGQASRRPEAWWRGCCVEVRWRGCRVEVWWRRCRAKLVARTVSGRAGLALRGSVVARLPSGSEVGRSSASGGVEVEEGD